MSRNDLAKTRNKAFLRKRSGHGQRRHVIQATSYGVQLSGCACNPVATARPERVLCLQASIAKNLMTWISTRTG